MKVFIYILSDPATGEVRYVGKTTDPKWRFYGHIHGHGRSNQGKKEWISGLLAKGLKPVMEVIDESNEKDWREAERYWISSLRFLGVNLLNIDGGGYGGRDLWTPEMKQKIANSISAAYVNNPSLRERQSRNARARKHSPESIAKMRAIKKAHCQRPEYIAKMKVVYAYRSWGAALQRAFDPPKIKPPRKTRTKWYPWTENQREIMKRKMTGRKASPEVLEKLRIASTRSWANPEIRARIHNAILKKHGHAIQTNQP